MLPCYGTVRSATTVDQRIIRRERGGGKRGRRHSWDARGATKPQVTHTHNTTHMHTTYTCRTILTTNHHQYKSKDSQFREKCVSPSPGTAVQQRKMLLIREREREGEREGWPASSTGGRRSGVGQATQARAKPSTRANTNSTCKTKNEKRKGDKGSDIDACTWKAKWHSP